MRLAPLLILLLVTPSAAANPLELFGFGSRSTAMAGATTADGRGADAAHHNPAAVALAQHPEVLIGYGYGAMQLHLNNADAQVLDAHGTTVGMALPIQITPSIRAAFGLALYLPDQFLARIALIPASEPHFVLLDNNPHRVVVEPVIGVQLTEHISLGAGASLLSNVSGNGISFDVGVTGGEKVAVAAVDASLPARMAPVLGLLVLPTPGTRLAASYRGANGIDLSLDILARVDVANVVTGDTLVSLRSTSYYTPRRATAAAALEATDSLTLTGELTWHNWSRHPSTVADLRVLVNLDTAPPLVDSQVPQANFHDVLTTRLGAEWRWRTTRSELAARAGYGYLPSPVPEQSGRTSLADNTRHLVTAGIGLTLADWAPLLTRPISLELGVQWHHLQRQLTVKAAESYPGQPFSSGGDILYASTTLKVAF